MLTDDVARAVKERLGQLPRRVTLHVFTSEDRVLVPGRDPSPGVRETVQLLQELAGLVDTVSVEVHNLHTDEELAARFGVERAPAIVPVAQGDEGEVDYGIRFYGPPAGYEFGSLLEAIELVAAGSADLPAQAADTLEGVDEAVHLRIFTTPTCPFCPGAVRAGMEFSVARENVRVDVIDATGYPLLSRAYAVSGVPKVVINDRASFAGALPPEQFARAIAMAVGRADGRGGDGGDGGDGGRGGDAAHGEATGRQA